MPEEEAEKVNKAGNVTVSVTSGDFPLHLFKEWESDCKKNFNDIRWRKMVHDHDAAKREVLTISLIQETESLKARIDALENEEGNEKKIKTFGADGNG